MDWRTDFGVVYVDMPKDRQKAWWCAIRLIDDLLADVEGADPGIFRPVVSPDENEVSREKMPIL